MQYWTGQRQLVLPLRSFFLPCRRGSKNPIQQSVEFSHLEMAIYLSCNSTQVLIGRRTWCDFQISISALPQIKLENGFNAMFIPGGAGSPFISYLQVLHSTTSSSDYSTTPSPAKVGEILCTFTLVIANWTEAQGIDRIGHHPATISTVMHFCLAMQFFCRSVVVR